MPRAARMQRPSPGLARDPYPRSRSRRPWVAVRWQEAIARWRGQYVREMPSLAQDRSEVFDVHNRYAEAADRRDWSLYDHVFTVDATADYGVSKLTGREAIVKLIRKNLAGCGPTQHLLGNHTAQVDGDEAHGSCKVRAFGQGAGARSAETYEILGTYHHDLVRTAEGWRTRHLRMTVAIELGTRDVLQP